MKNSLQQAGGILRRLRGDRRANVAPIFAVLAMPIIGLMGMAVDINLAMRAKSQTQMALDAAAMAAGRALAAGEEDAYVQQEFQKYFAALLQEDPGNVTCQTPTLVPVPNSETMIATADCTVDTLISHAALGRDQVAFDVRARVTLGIGKVDMVFVLDASGSMNNNSGTPNVTRLDALKTAVTAAVDMMLTYETDDEDDVRIALTAYSSGVNAGAYFNAVTNKDANRTYTATYYEKQKTGRVCVSWKRKRGKRRCDDWENQYTFEPRTSSRTINSSCTYERDSSEWADATEPRAGHWIFAPDATASGTNWEEYEGTWYNKGVSWSVPSTSCPSATQLPLTADKDTLDTYITNLTAGGGTAGHLGVQWGRYLISPDFKTVWPSDSEPLAWDEPDSMKVLVMMTDGDFNSVWHDDNGNSFAQARQHCDNAKAEGVLIYTVAFRAPTAGQTVLNYCASGPDFRFDANNGQELLDAYTAIAYSISELRLAG